MSALATTRLSSKGQVVIPEEVRERLGLSAGDQFVVVADRDVIVLKAITSPERDFDSLLEKARRQARAARLRKRDVQQAIRETRRRK